MKNLQPIADQAKAIGYVRVSTGKVEQTDSYEHQAARIETYCKAHGLELLDIVAERASAFGDKGAQRPAFNRMLAELKAMPDAERPFQVIVVKNSRFSREMVDSLVWQRDLRRLGVELYELDTNRVINRKEHQIIAAVEALAAESESTQKGQAMVDSYDRRRTAKTQVVIANNSPLGLRVIKGVDVVVPDQVIHTRELFTKYASGMGGHRLAAHMRTVCPERVTITPTAGEPEVKRRALRWDTSSVMRLLKNPRLRRDDVIPAELFDRCQQIIKSRPRTANTRKREFVLVGALVCPDCGRKLSTTGNFDARYNREYRYYKCRQPGHPRFPADAVETNFRAITGKLETDPKALRHWVAQATGSRVDDSAAHKRAIAELERKVAGIDGERMALLDKLGALPKKTATQYANALEERHRADTLRLAELKKTGKSKDEIKRDLDIAAATLAGFWASYDATPAYETRKRMVRALVDSIPGVFTVNAKNKIVQRTSKGSVA